jgi:hypothetical protein
MALATRISDKERLSNGDLRLKATVVPLAGKVSVGPAKMRAKLRALGEEGIITNEDFDLGRAYLGRAKVENVNMHNETMLGLAEHITFTIRVKA